MGKIKEIFTEIQEKLGEDVEITEEIFTQHLIEKGIIKEEE
jgi:hypothetical protein